CPVDPGAAGATARDSRQRRDRAGLDDGMTIERAQVLNGLLLVALLALFVVVMGQVQNDYYVKIVMLIGMNVILAVGLTMTSGFTGVFSRAGWSAAPTCTRRWP